jgi:raffinose/stachyose/melibiose transport system permease protein
MKMKTDCLTSALQSWNELLFAQVFVSKEAFRTLTAGIQSMYGRYQTDWGPIGAALAVTILPTLFLYLLMSREVQKSLLAGQLRDNALCILIPRFHYIELSEAGCAGAGDCNV